MSRQALMPKEDKTSTNGLKYLTDAGRCDQRLVAPRLGEFLRMGL
jgi:hypothetical protein